ncbi:MAG: (5-formylfuran-3-yl)methyl phosphate synthase [Candidatus Methylomirabilaceae bacterium]
MKLLISVRDEDEAAAAVAGGADIVDVKNPDEGSLGAQQPHVIAAIARMIPVGIDVSASIGDVPNLPGTVALAGLGAALCGIRFVKVGLLGTRTPAEAARLLEVLSGALTLANRRIGLVACAYADADHVGSLDPILLPQMAAPFVEGCMIDTAIKDGRSLFHYLPDAAVARFIERCRDRGLFAALAGSLRPEDFSRVRTHGADIVGIRSAACLGGRGGTLSPERVRALKASLIASSPCAHASPDRLAAL